MTKKKVKEILDHIRVFEQIVAYENEEVDEACNAAINSIDENEKLNKENEELINYLEKANNTNAELIGLVEKSSVIRLLTVEEAATELGCNTLDTTYSWLCTLRVLEKCGFHICKIESKEKENVHS